ncbi:histidine kinase [Pseudonocardia sediminis]|nr:histidine kinase [Pseudonocardia sediminis]
MLPTPGELAEATDPDRWAVEFGWEGHRCVAYARPGRVRLLSSTARSVTGSFPELAALGEQAPASGMVLDGTVVALDEAGRPSRRPLMRRTNTVRPDAALQSEVPVGYVVTDLLWADGQRVLDLPYRERRHELEALGLGGPTILVSPSFGLDEADLVMRTAEQYGLDGLHLKRLDVPYQPGRRTRNWLRVPLRRTRQVVVGGWIPAGRSDRIAAVLLGLPGPGGLAYVGRVGISTTHAGDDVETLLDEPVARDSPFTGPVPDDVAAYARWLDGDLVALVEHRGRTVAGRLALPTWLGLVDSGDADPELWEPGPPVAAPDPPSAADTPVPPAEQHVPASAEREEEDRSPWHGPLSRRLEQHFVYNTLNTIAALVRTDPPRARELLLGFADLSRAADRAGEASIPLADELGAVRAYLMIERTRFGKRLDAGVETDDALADAPVPPLAVLAAVRAAVQQWVEPDPDGGAVRVTTRPGRAGGAPTCLVTAWTAGSPAPVTVLALDLPDPPD